MLNGKKLSLILCVALFASSAFAHDGHRRVSVPEPSSIAFAGAGLVGLVGAIRRKVRGA